MRIDESVELLCGLWLEISHYSVSSSCLSLAVRLSRLATSVRLLGQSLVLVVCCV